MRSLNVANIFRVFIVVSIFGAAEKLPAQKVKNADSKTQSPVFYQPKLVVGIVVDQMRYEYLTRFYTRYGEGGFKRLVTDGFNCKNNHFNYIPTYTGPGHASIYTGTTPQNHGIISNNWYDKFGKEVVYCASDTTVVSIGCSSLSERMSPRRMKTTTVGDQNRLHTQMRGKTIGISLKDRGAILPAGHTANAAYWFRGRDMGAWITSSYYMEELPKWVQDFNASKKIKSYLREWNTLYEITTYKESGTDENNFEKGFQGVKGVSFPYDLKKLQDENGGFDIIKASPYGNSLVADFAIEALASEALGTDRDTDFLTISFSSTDYVGHNFGVNSKEIEDTYLRLDQDIERVLTALDNKVGKENYTLFLTADHGAVHVPAYLESMNIPAGYFDVGTFETALEDFVRKTYAIENLIEKVDSEQVFFNYPVLYKNKLSPIELQNTISQFVVQYSQIDKVFTREQLISGNYTKGLGALIQNGFNQKRSGDVVFVLDPAVITYPKKGSTHGSGNSYDTHVPLIFFGQGIKKGSTLTKTQIVDIAPTISSLLGIAFPNGATGMILEEVIK